MKKEKIEYRTSEIENFDAENNTVEGYAMLFDTESSNLSFSEVISRSAITEETLKQSDVFACIDHDRNKGILARSRYGAGSLSLTIDDKGLKYQFSLPDTPVGQELRSYLERGEINSSSFAFTVAAEEWSSVGDKYTRNVNSIDRIYDVSPVFNAAYDGTDVTLRGTEVALNSLAQIKENEAKALEELKVQERKAECQRKIRMMKMKAGIK
jgi:HK97 family phage prohead protease